jgi:endonuclease V-like protein UPF0215 family
MKTQIRILGIDDGAFKFEDQTTPVVGVVMRLPNYVEGVMVTEVTVDGELDSTEKLIDMISASRYLDQLKLILMDGAALGGFNVVNIERLHDQLGIPIATITRDEPNFEEIEAALKKHFEDWNLRLAMMKKVEIKRFETEHNPVYVSRVGIGDRELAEILDKSTVKGALPEVLRVAHLIATAISKGESRGRA